MTYKIQPRGAIRWIALSHLFAIAVMSVISASVMAQTYNYLPQGWSNDERQWFYYANQGSRLIPYVVFLHLEQQDKSELFRSGLNMRGLGYLPGMKNQFNPDGLPIGFTRDGQYLGLTCAACHTNEIRSNDQTIIIDGGQSNGDLQNLLSGLNKSIKHTLSNPAAFSRFAERVKQTHGFDSEKTRAVLKQADEMITDTTSRNATEVPYGFSRLDAFGAILNKGLAAAGVPENMNSPNAPTSYPYIWDTPQHDWVEWNGSSSNPLEGALARNVGQVIGVFGHLDGRAAKWLGFIDAGYRSSIRTRTLRRIEKLVAELRSPRWRDAGLPEIDQAAAKAGEHLYAEYCGYCHLDIERDDPRRKIQVRMSSLAVAGTDPMMAKNAVELQGKTGRFEGGKRFYFKGDVMGPTAPALYIVNHIMGGVVKNNLIQALLSRQDARNFGHAKERHPVKYLDGEPMTRGTETTDKALLAYKARPMNGVWASPPYLHNGSVPNLYELMLPAEKRSKTFYLGNWQFDTTRVGYASEALPDSFLFDTTLPGNGNQGHEYGTGLDGRPALTHEEILSVIEYIKTL